MDEPIPLNNSFGALTDDSLPSSEEETPSDESGNRTRRPGHHLRVLVVNCRSLKSITKQTGFAELAELHKPDIIMGTESHLDNTIATSEVFPPGYTDIFRNDRNCNGGGVFLAISETLVATEHAKSPNSELIWAKITLRGSKPLYAGAFYRPPNIDNQPIEDLHSSLENIPDRNNNLPNIILGGDLNLPSIDWENNNVKHQPQYGLNINQELVDMVNDHSLSQCVQEPTRENNILDLLFTTNPDLVRSVKVEAGMSDHRVVIADLDLKAKLNKKKHRKVYLYKKGNMDGVRQELAQCFPRFNEEHSDSSVEDSWSAFKTIMNGAMEKHIPQKTLSGRWDIPWMTRDIKKQIRLKQRLYKKAKNTRLHTDWAKFKAKQVAVKNLLAQAHEDHLSSLLNFDNNDERERISVTKKFWSYVKSKRRDISGVSPLIKDNKEVTDSKGKAEILNDQYDSVFTNEDLASIPILQDKNIPPLPDMDISVRGITKLLEKLNPQKANGPDHVPTRVLKEAATEIAPYLHLIFNKSLLTSDLPIDWLTANISPIYKKGSRSVAANYRPVSLTSVSCKLLEHIIFHHIMGHLNQHHILSDYQHGFRTKHSCETQLVTTIDDLAKSLDNGKQVDMLILDFSKAFDTVAHQRLINKLDNYGITNNVKSWITTWLTSRTQRVVVDGEQSSDARVRSGVPQGTVLGPLMFLLYINDIGDKISDNTNIRLFADDSLLYRETGNNPDSDTLQHDLDKLVEWSSTWQMNFHPMKCYHLRISRKKVPLDTHYTMLGHTLERVDHYPYLGVEISGDLSWNKHITKVTSKAQRALGFVRRNLSSTPRPVKVQMYRALVRPHLEYAAAAWDPYTQKNIWELEMVQRRAARFVVSNYSREPGTVTNIMTDLQWPTLESRRMVSRLCLLHKAIHNQVAVTLPPYITQPTRHTRQSHQQRYLQVRTNTKTHQYSFFPRTIKEWNGLPPNILAINEADLFKTAVSSHIMH